MKARIKAGALAAAGLAGRALLRVPGLAALGCAVGGAYVLWGLGWALLVAVPFLLVIDREL